MAQGQVQLVVNAIELRSAAWCNAVQPGAPMVKLVDTADLKSAASEQGRAGSIPARGTMSYVQQRSDAAIFVAILR